MHTRVLFLSAFACALLACTHTAVDPEPVGTAVASAEVGDPCADDGDCAGINGYCLGGFCVGIDSDPCPLVQMSGDPAPCAPEYLCRPCDPDVFGVYECGCRDHITDEPQPCAPAVCLPLFDACTVSCSAECDGIAGCP